MWTATGQRFLHPINPVGAPMFTVCVYVALAGLAALKVPVSRRVHLTVWAPTLAHAVLIAFASYSFAVHGHWPWYSAPDPKYLHVPVLYGAAVLSVLAGALSIPAGLLALVALAVEMRRQNWREKLPRWVHSAAVLVMGTWLWVFEWRDRRLIEWLAD